MINLCLVVIATQFSETKKRETERMILERKRSHSSSTLENDSERGGCYIEMLKYLGHLWRRAKRKIIRKIRQHSNNRLRKVTPEKAISLRRKQRRKRSCSAHLQHHTCQQQALLINHNHHHHLIQHYPAVNSRRRTLCSSHLTPLVSLAPRASPEVSEFDLASSPRRPNCLEVQGELCHSTSEPLPHPTSTTPLTTHPPVLSSRIPREAASSLAGNQPEQPPYPNSSTLFVPEVQLHPPIPRCMITPGSPVPCVSRDSSSNDGSLRSVPLSPAYACRSPSPTYVPDVVATYNPRHSYAPSKRLRVHDGSSPRRPKLVSIRGRSRCFLNLLSHLINNMQ